MSQTSVQTAHRDSPDEPETQASEETPLLGDGEHTVTNNPERDVERTEEASTTQRRFSFTMTWLRLNLLSLTLSILAFTLSIAYLIYSEVSVVHYSWTLTECIRGIAITAVVAFFVSLINLRSIQRDGRQIPRVINIIIDGIVCFYLISYSIVAFNWIDWSNCSSWASRHCRELEIIGRAIGGSAAAIAIALGITHLVLFTWRLRDAYRSRFWQQPLSFPNGQFKVEFSIKFLRNPEGSGPSATS